MESTYTIGSDGKIVGTPVFKRIGNGWGGRFLIQSQYKASAAGKPTRTMLYSQDMYGKFGRWTDVGKGLRNTGFVTGMSTMKSFALIATTPTYDMFLANNRAGGLYTVKIPTSVPLKPIITPVRTSSWQIFEQLVVPADVTSEQSVAEAADLVQSRLGDLDLLVNNAGLMQVTPFGDAPAAQRFLPGMATYGASKAGVSYLTRALRTELALIAYVISRPRDVNLPHLIIQPSKEI
ncbi:SDR family NAD(P)-dependent oxidoreductase [Kribbella sp. C-35]|uniref:SDR family NAD(P)-dependent oxidoreductase n=1 Tax=Kribbella sp. C-35 TaxID=2789276 RepID=UPI00397C4D3F